MNGNGDDMQKSTSKIHTDSSRDNRYSGHHFHQFQSWRYRRGEEEEKEESREFVALEQALMKIEGIGEVILYFHYENSEATNPLSDYFSSIHSYSKKGNELQGILVVAEGAEDSQDSKTNYHKFCQRPSIARTSDRHRRNEKKGEH